MRYLGGCALAVFCISIWPVMLFRLSQCPPVFTLSLSLLVWLIEILFSVWTVAYNFVPGGVYTREHTDWLCFAIILGIRLALWHGKWISYSTVRFNIYEISRNGKSIVLLLQAQRTTPQNIAHRTNQS